MTHILNIVSIHLFRGCWQCLHRHGRVQGHDLPHPWSLGILCRSAINVKRTFKSIPPKDGEPGYGVFDGGVLLSRHTRGEKGFCLHYIVGKGHSDAALEYVGYHQ